MAAPAHPQWGATSSWPAWAAWECIQCSSTNWSDKKKCRVCGVKKSYSSAVACGGAYAGATFGSAVAAPRGSADYVQRTKPPMARAAVAQAAPAAEWAPAPRGHAAAEQTTTVVVDGATVSADRAQLHQSIRSLNAALAQLPDSPEHQVTRNFLHTAIAEHKRSITAMRPLGAQLDGCRAALQRAEARKEKAQQARDDAELAIATAASEIDQLTSELAALEMQVSQPDPAPSSPDCVDKLTGSLSAVIDEMAASQHVPADLVEQTRLQMSALLGGIKAIAAAARSAAGAPAAGAAAPPAVPADREAAVHATAAPDDVGGGGDGAAALGSGPVRRRCGTKTDAASTPYGPPPQAPANGSGD